MILDIIFNIINEVHPQKIFENQLKFYNDDLYVKGSKLNLSSFSKIHILGVGKAASVQVRALLTLIEVNGFTKQIGRVVSVTKIDHSIYDKDIEEIESTHPLCSEYSVIAANKIFNLVGSFDENDLLLFCLSGGASALIASQVDAISLEDKINVGQMLLKSGASIVEMNVLRKELSKIKNGGLAASCRAKTIVNLTISDVPISDFSIIGSSPTYYKNIDKMEVKDLATKYLSGDPILCQKVINYVDSAERQTLCEERVRLIQAKNIRNFIIADFNYLMERAIVTFSKKRSEQIIAVDHCFDCMVDDAVDEHLSLIKNNLNKPFILISGGEATVKVQGNGLGGRNLHFCACLAQKLFAENILNLTIEQLKMITIYSVGTDGTDGSTDYAGAWLDYDHFIKVKNQDVKLKFFINDFNTFEYFKISQTLIKTGPTGTNIMDFRVISYDIEKHE